MEKNQIEEAAREVRNAYYRKWRKENRLKVSAYNRRYWEHKAEATMKQREAKEDSRHE